VGFLRGEEVSAVRQGDGSRESELRGPSEAGAGPTTWLREWQSRTGGSKSGWGAAQVRRR